MSESQPSKTKLVLTATMQMEVFGVPVTLSGQYAGDVCTLSCKADLSEKGGELKKHFSEVVPKDWLYVIDKIDLRQMLVEVRFSQKTGLLYYSIGAAISVGGKLLTFLLFKQDKELLVSMHMQGAIAFSALPLVGEYLSRDDGIDDLQVVYYKSSDNAGNNNLYKFVSPPKLLSRYPDKRALLKPGVNIFAHAQLGAFKMPLSYPLDVIVDSQSQPETSPAPDTLPATTAGVQPVKTQPAGNRQFLEVKKLELLYTGGQIGVKISGKVSVSIFELEVLGLQLSAPLDIFSNFDIKRLNFDLEGLSLDIQKPPLSITGAFLRVKDDAGDDYLGLISVGFNQFQFAAVGAYSKRGDQSSLFIFAFIGIPLGGPAFFFVTGLAFGFGLNRDFILPDISKIGSFPLVRLCVENKPATQSAEKSKKDSVLDMLKILSESIPPNIGSYFIIAGLRFETFKIIRTVAIAVVKFGNEFEINLLGISTLTLPSVYLELAFSVQFAPAKGIFMARGQFTNRSYLLFPDVALTGGFAAGFWFSGIYSGDFVITAGGYHPKYKVPPHFPSNIPRVGIRAVLGDAVIISGELYFAITPQAIMAGLAVSVICNSGMLYACISLRADLIILWKPFYYEAIVSVDVYVKFTIGKGFFSKDFDFNLHASVAVWGPDFSGKAHLDAGIKTFEVSFGANAPRFAPPLTWNQFKDDFIPQKPCVINVAGGLIDKVKITPQGQENEIEYLIINPKELVLVTDSAIPATFAFFGDQKLTTANIGRPGIAPMNRAEFNARHSVSIYKIEAGRKQIVNFDKQGERFSYKQLTKNLPMAIWGSRQPDSKQPPDANNSLLRDALTGIEIRPVEVTGGQSDELSDNSLNYRELIHKKNYHSVKGVLEIDAENIDMKTSHQNYADAARTRAAAVTLLIPNINVDEIDISDIAGDIPVYSYTEPFIATHLVDK
ncbi:DUF6603 domain-containing protein [Mucilaginibacter jinjuensis]|uniref:DUF6603 domain-containing protein n=1 Tax=Mucilaginibacter jinjuensis TaxID=1176721 RepID=A0ABY7T2S0_9SPHI|nr:DUF6603 domain-containing protein [Mucilaginibacter jinjuensis]WCT10480.1 hypothetical protein PQO05_17220 [Mucilaginibacter jinjuensis]